MKAKLSRLPILLLMLYFIAHSIEFSEDTVDITYFKKPAPSLNLVNDSISEIVVDSIKINLIEGKIFKEMTFSFSVDSFYIENGHMSRDELWNTYGKMFHYTTTKEDDSIFYLKYFKGSKTNIVMPSRSRRKIELIETGTNLNNVIVNLPKRSQVLSESYDYTIRLTMYANDNTMSDVVIKGNNVEYSAIKYEKTNQINKSNSLQLSKCTYDLLGRNLEIRLFSAMSKIIILRSNENKFKTFQVFSK